MITKGKKEAMLEDAEMKIQSQVRSPASAIYA